MQCGCIGTIPICDVKDKITTPWRHLNRVKITVPLMLYYCDNCGNTPMYSEDIDKMDKAIEDSLAKKALQNVYLFKKGDLYRVGDIFTTGYVENILEANLFTYEEANMLEYKQHNPNEEHAIPLYSELLNKKINTNLFTHLAKQINEMKRVEIQAYYNEKKK